MTKLIEIILILYLSQQILTKEMFVYNKINSVILGCSTGEYEEGGKCYPCMDNCQDCDDKNTCTKCKGGFRVTTDNKCEACTLAHCATCKDSKDTCKGCLTNYILHSNVCEKCDVSGKCLYCGFNKDKEKYCITCPSGYSPSGETCVSCTVDHCEDCVNNKDVCMSCVNNYYKKDNKCLLCSDMYTGCKTCDSNTCFSCTKNLILSSDKKKCISGCTSLEYKDPLSENCKSCVSVIKNFCDDQSCDACYKTPTAQNCENCFKACIKQFDEDSCIQCNTNAQFVDDKCQLKTGFSSKKLYSIVSLLVGTILFIF